LEELKQQVILYRKKLGVEVTEKVNEPVQQSTQEVEPESQSKPPSIPAPTLPETTINIATVIASL